MELILPADRSSSSVFDTRDSPRVVLNHSEPLPSSSIWKMLSLRRPCLDVYRKKEPSLKRLSPPPKVPIHNVPSWDCVKARIRSLESPSAVVKCRACPLSSRHKPEPREPAHRTDPMPSHNTPMKSLSSRPPGMIFRNRPATSWLKPSSLAIQIRPLRSSSAS